MFITLTVYDNYGGYTHPYSFNINKIDCFYPVDMEDAEEKPEWNTVIVIDGILYYIMEDFGYVSGAINEIVSSRT